MGVNIKAIGFGGIQGGKLYTCMHIILVLWRKHLNVSDCPIYAQIIKIGENEGHYLFEHMEQF